MRIVNAILAVVLLLFAAANFEEPAGALLLPVLGIGAFWTLLAAALPRWLAMRPLVMLLSFTMAAILLGLIYFWPDAPGWWRAEVWSEAEAVRELSGLMLVALALFGPILTSIRMERARRQEALEAKEAKIAARHRAALTGGAALDA